MQTVRSALTGSGEVTHPSVQKFMTEAALFKHVGMNFNDLRDRPRQELLDYITIASLIVHEENRRAKQQEAESRNRR